MIKHELKIMAVDDDEINLEIIGKNLKDAGFQCIQFADGDVAWEYLSNNPEDIDIVLMDKMMPRMNGMDVLRKMKSHSLLQNIPVILQTGDIGAEQTGEGLAAGAYYYLEKPFAPSVMIALINAALRDTQQKNDIRTILKKEKTFATMLLDGRFRYKNIDEAKRLAAALAIHAQNPGEMGIALAEILVNAVEHGNLGIGYDTKSTLMAENRLEEEIQARLAAPENKNKVVCVRFQKEAKIVSIIINDEGKGFAWEKYLEFDPLRLTDMNGRGIATATLMGLSIEYRDNGSTAVCSYKIAEEEAA